MALGYTQALSAAEQGDAIPDCTLTATDGTVLNFKQFQGKVLYVDFWASWCGPCAKSFPFMNSLNQEFKESGLEMIAVNLDEKSSDAQDFISQNPAGFTIAADAHEQCATDIGLKAMPSTYLVDREGRIRHIHLGFKPEEAAQLKTLVRQLLAEQ